MSDTGFADGFANGVADGDGDVRVRPVAPRRAATAGAAAAAGRAAPRSRAAELAFTNLIHVKALSLFVDAKIAWDAATHSNGHFQGWLAESASQEDASRFF